MSYRSARRLLAPVLLAAAAAVIAVVVAAAPRSATHAVAGVRVKACPRGLVRERDGGEAERGGGRCARLGHPEGGELLQVNAARASQTTAPFSQVRAGAGAASVREAAALAGNQDSVPGAGGDWTPLGKGALDASDTTYDQTGGSTSEGFYGVTGRVEDFAYDAADHRLFAAPVNGGVWQSDDRGASWRSVGDGLPTQVVGSVAWTKAGGGTLLALTGDPAFGFESTAGMGVYRSTDGGATWARGAGLPDGALGFQLAVDPNKPDRIYAATSAGLYRSDDDGASWQNLMLPTGDCAGHTFDVKGCFLANIVTDVVVQGRPDKATTGAGAKPGAVLAAVGWRAGQRDNKQNPPRPESPQNGIYVSGDGSSGSFKFIDAADSGFVNGDQTAIGRVALGIANGPSQDHRIVYAVVQDANKFNGNIGSDVLDEAPSGVFSTIFNGVWVSSDFGRTWTEMESSNEMDNDPTTNSALEPAGKALSYEPGVQSWYNEWVAPDPTQQDADGVPTRVVFGLEEVWENRPTGPQNGPTAFHVIGRYWNACQFGLAPSGVPRCDADPQQSATTSASTTHPDQHAGLFVPGADGKGVTLYAGSDGGVFRQRVASGQDFSNSGWSNNPTLKVPSAQGTGDLALHILQPYDVEMAKDGTAYMGMQDNGEGKILPDGTQKEIYGGDGFFTAVDPDNSNIAWEEYARGLMAATTDGGKTWQDEDPNLTSAQFSTPFKMDPANARHLLVGGRDIEETTAGTDTDSCVDPACAFINIGWNKVYDLGTMKHPGDPDASTDDVTGDPTDAENSATAIELQGANAYVGFCGFCDVITQDAPFHNGLATNVAGAASPEPDSSRGWHIASAIGLPNRFITSIATDPSNPETVYVALAGYGRHWAPPGARGEDPENVGVGHVFRSTDAGQHFTDVSGDLPDTPVDSLILHGGQLVVGTDIGAFISSDTNGSSWAPLGSDLPRTPVVHLAPKPGDPDTIVAATYGRGAYTYRFPAGAATVRSAQATSTSTGPVSAAPVPLACQAGTGFRRVAARAHGSTVRLAVARRASGVARVDVLQSAVGRRVEGLRPVARFRGVHGSFTWDGRANVRGARVRDGYVVVRFSEPLAGGATDVRSAALERSHGRFRARPGFARAAGCGLLRAYSLSGPAFGGTGGRALAISYRLARRARVSVVVMNGSGVVHRFHTVTASPGRANVLRLAATGRPRGDYRVRLTASRGGELVSAALVSRRL